VAAITPERNSSAALSQKPPKQHLQRGIGSIPSAMSPQCRSRRSSICLGQQSAFGDLPTSSTATTPSTFDQEWPTEFEPPTAEAAEAAS